MKRKDIVDQLTQAYIDADYLGFFTLIATYNGPWFREHSLRKLKNYIGQLRHLQEEVTLGLLSPQGYKYRLTAYEDTLMHCLQIAKLEWLASDEEQPELNPENRETQQELLIATDFLQRGEFEEAERKAERILNMRGNQQQMASAMNIIGRVAEHNDDQQAAIDAFLWAVERAPDDSDFWYNLGNARINAGKHERGRENLKKAIELEPHHTLALDSLGNSYIITGDYQAALAPFQESILLNPHSVNSYTQICSAYAYLGDTGNAERFYDLAARKKSKQLAVLRKLIITYCN